MADGTQRNLFDTEAPPWVEDEQSDLCVAQVVFVAAPYGPFDYLVPDRWRSLVEPGARVRVPLGRGRRFRAGYCTRIGNGRWPGEKPVVRSRLKPIEGVIDEAPLLTGELLELAAWIADYYQCPVGRVIETMVPASVRGQAGTRRQVFLRVPNTVIARMTRLKLPEKQSRALKCLAGAPHPLTAAQLAKLADCTQAPITALRKKGLIADESRRVPTRGADPVSKPLGQPLVLNQDQLRALTAIKAAIAGERFQGLLLHGITGSGKTEVYIQAIEEVMGYGRQAIVLVPEISLTPQTCQRFGERFEGVAVLHSNLTPGERNHQWKRILAGEVQVVIGARSAVFAPLPKLGLIVLDEEHDASFKQDKAPRYHARDVALRRGESARCPVVLGSATPSLESWQAAISGRYRKLTLPQRVQGLPLPDVSVVDLRTEVRQRGRGLLSRPMRGAIKDALRNGDQVILMLNRRGFARHIQCPACGHAVKCPDCDISLTYHQDGRSAICHYCQYRTKAPQVCPECRFEGIRFFGHGTQKLAAEMERVFPEARCLRMDSDSMRRPGSHHEALERFRKGEVDVLIGTQMIAKGLDFPNVTLVGVVDADTTLHFPDFRSAERTFSLVAQVAGRSGRGEKGGRVILQTLSPEHEAIEAARSHDYEGFARDELESRREFGYPPFGSLARYVFRGENKDRTEEFAQAAIDRIHEDPRIESAGIRILGPVEASIQRIRNRYRFHALMFGPAGFPLQPVLREAADRFPDSRAVEWMVDVDPLEML